MCDLKFRLVDIGANRLSVRRDPASQFQRGIAATAPGIQARMPAAQPKLVEQRARAGVQHARENAEPFATLDPAPNHIVTGIRHRQPCSIFMNQRITVKSRPSLG